MREFHIERLIIGVCGDPPSSAGFQGAAVVARIFDAGLSALVLADDTAKTLRGLSFAREYQPASQRWLNLGVEQMQRDHDRLQLRARRLLAEAARHAGVGEGSDVRESPLELVTAEAGKNDILCLVPPAGTGETLLWPFAGLSEACMLSKAHVLILPPQGVRNKGAVTVLAGGLHGDEIALAHRIATPAGRVLVIDETAGAGRIRESIRSMAEDEGVRFLVASREDARRLGVEFFLRLAIRQGIASLFTPDE